MLSYMLGLPVAAFPKDPRDMRLQMEDFNGPIRGGMVERLVAVCAKNSPNSQTAERWWLTK